MGQMRAVQVSEAGGAFELIEREVPEPGFDQALVRVHACGVCHSDVLAKDGGFPGVSHPLVPGHEIAGVIEALGAGVQGPSGRSDAVARSGCWVVWAVRA